MRAKNINSKEMFEILDINQLYLFGLYTLASVKSGKIIKVSGVKMKKDYEVCK